MKLYYLRTLLNDRGQLIINYEEAVIKKETEKQFQVVVDGMFARTVNKSKLNKITTGIWNNDVSRIKYECWTTDEFLEQMKQGQLELVIRDLKHYHKQVMDKVETIKQLGMWDNE